MKPSILFLDIETAPDVAYVWGVYQQNAIAIKEHWYILSAAWKWRGENDSLDVLGLCNIPGYTKGRAKEKALLHEIWLLLDRADIVVAHNGADFDIKKLNAKFIEYDFKPYSPVKVVDTKRDLVSVARFSSHRLDWLMKQFKIGGKITTNFDLWEGCMDGDRDSWQKMMEYNLHDVVLLEKLYDKISPWIPQPNATIYDGQLHCVKPNCDGKLIKRGLSYAKTRVYQRYSCNKCGAPARDVNSIGGSKITPAV